MSPGIKKNGLLNGFENTVQKLESQEIKSLRPPLNQSRCRNWFRRWSAYMPREKCVRYTGSSAGGI